MPDDEASPEEAYDYQKRLLDIFSGNADYVPSMDLTEVPPGCIVKIDGQTDMAKIITVEEYEAETGNKWGEDAD